MGNTVREVKDKSSHDLSELQNELNGARNDLDLKTLFRYRTNLLEETVLCCCDSTYKEEEFFS